MTAPNPINEGLTVGQEYQMPAVQVPELAVEEQVSPYERLTDEQLKLVRDNVTNSFIAGVLSYDTDEALRALGNIVRIREEFGRRWPDEFPDGRRIEDRTIYTNNVDQAVVDLVKKARQETGDITFLGKLEGTLFSHDQDYEGINRDDTEKYFQHVEKSAILTELIREIGGERDKFGVRKNYVKSDNQYALTPNDKLDITEGRLIAGIEGLKAKGKHSEAEEMEKNLKKLQEVKRQRAAWKSYGNNIRQELEVGQESGATGDDFEKKAATEIGEIRSKAESEGRDLNPDEIQRIRDIAKYVQDQRIANMPQEEFEKYINGRVNIIRSEAETKGRDLTPEEIAKIKALALDVQNRRRSNAA